MFLIIYSLLISKEGIWEKVNNIDRKIMEEEDIEVGGRVE